MEVQPGEGGVVQRVADGVADADVLQVHGPRHLQVANCAVGIMVRTG